MTASSRTLLSVDGGGTKTLALVLTSSGQELGRGVAGSSNVNTVGPAQAGQAVATASEAALRAAGLSIAQVARACLGMAGIDRPAVRERWRAWCAAIWPGLHVHLVTDGALVLAALDPAGPGLALIAGTGALGLCRDQHGQITRASGWGPTLGDEGSAFWIGQSALRAIVRAEDGRGPTTRLKDRVFARWALSSWPAFMAFIHEGSASRAEIAELAREVDEVAAADHDPIALEILDAAARELALTLTTLTTRAGLTGSVPLAYTGGVLLNSRRVREHTLGGRLGPSLAVPEPAAQGWRLLPPS